MTIKNDNLLFIQANPGCGKSHELISIAADSFKNNENVQFLSSIRQAVFDLKEKANMRRLTGDRVGIQTLHSFALEILEKSNLFGLEIKKIKEDFRRLENETSKNTKRESAIFDSILELFVRNFEKIKGQISTDTLLVDETQDLTGLNYSAFEKIVRYLYQNGKKIVLAADENQTIFSDSFEASEIIRTMNFRQQNLTICKRLNPSIQNFVNGFYEKNGFKDLYTIPANLNSSERNVHLTFVNDMQSVMHQILKGLEHPSNANDKIMIVCRTTRECKNIQTYLMKNNALANVDIRTIHKAKGSEADSVFFLMMTQFNLKLKRELNLMNVALTRAKKDFHLISSIPAEEVQGLFLDETYVYRNLQTDYKSREGWNLCDEGEKLLSRIDQKTPLYLKNFSKSMIDSIDIEVKEFKYPYARIMGDNSGATRSGYNPIDEHSVSGIQYFVRRHKGNHYFEFRNVSPMKAAGFTDLEIVKVIKYIIFRHYGYRMNPDSIQKLKLRRIDLARIFRLDFPKEFMKCVNGIFQSEKSKSDTDKYLHYKFNLKSKQNRVKNKRGHREVMFYFPATKEKNRIADADLNDLKCEVRREKGSLGIKNNLNMTVEDFEKIIIDSSFNENAYDCNSPIYQMYLQFLRDETPQYRHKDLEKDARLSIKESNKNRKRKQLANVLRSVPDHLKELIEHLFGENSLLHSDNPALEDKYSRRKKHRLKKKK